MFIVFISLLSIAVGWYSSETSKKSASVPNLLPEVIYFDASNNIKRAKILRSFETIILISEEKEKTNAEKEKSNSPKNKHTPSKKFSFINKDYIHEIQAPALTSRVQKFIKDLTYSLFNSPKTLLVLLLLCSLILLGISFYEKRKDNE